MPTYCGAPDGTEKSDRSVVFHVLCGCARRADTVACAILYDSAVPLDPVDVLYKVKGVESWYRDRLDTNCGSLHSDDWKISFWKADGTFESSDEVRLWSWDVCMIDNWAASSDDIVNALVSEIVMKYEIYPLPGVTVETILESVRRTYVTESDAFVQALLRIVKQGVVCMIHAEKLMLSHERFVVASDFVRSTDHLEHTGLRVYVPDYVP